jgi:hypothetical protein
MKNRKDEPCEICRRNRRDGVVPSWGDFPEPLSVCRSCSVKFPFVERDGFPLLHFRSENGHWYFVYLHRDFLSPYFYPSSRPDHKYLSRDTGNRDSEIPLCRRIIPFTPDPPDDEDILYFSYGRTIDDSLLAARKIGFEIVGPATLYEARLDFSRPAARGASGRANLRSGGKDDYAMGLLYLLKRSRDLARLEKWDDIGGAESQTRRILVHLMSGQPVPAFTHVYAGVLAPLRPAMPYIGNIIRALRYHCFPERWIEILCRAGSIDVPAGDPETAGSCTALAPLPPI